MNLKVAVKSLCLPRHPGTRGNVGKNRWTWSAVRHICLQQCRMSHDLIPASRLAAAYPWCPVAPRG